MAGDQTDPSYQSPEDLAGPHFQQLMRSKQAALAHLSSPDNKVRLAAILICHSKWNCGGDARVVAACRDIAASSADDSFRDCAIGLLGMALSSSRALDASRFLANLIMDCGNSIRVRTGAYWALREIQFGVADTDFDTFLKGILHWTKKTLDALPGRFSEEEVKANLVPEGCFPEDFWDSSDQIDWEFVRQFI